MQHFKEKLYDYEATPPALVWQNINDALKEKANTKKIVPISSVSKKRNFLFYGLTAAASLIVILLISIFYNSSSNVNQSISSTELQTNKDSIKLNNETLENIIKASKDKNVAVKNNSTVSSKIKKYLTIAGPEGQPVKISPKVATLIESADNAYPPRAVWNKKIEKWKQIMLTSTLSPTSTNLLDIVQATPTEVDNNE